MNRLNGVEFYQADSFTTTAFLGNPAGVVPNADRLNDGDMQAIARELNNSETVFILNPDGTDHDIRLRFFTPTTEVPSCGHATIAANYILATKLGFNGSEIRQKTKAGLHKITVDRSSDNIRITMRQGKPEISQTLPGSLVQIIEEALQITSNDRHDALPIQIVSTGHSKVMIPLKSEELLNSLKPNSQALSAISKDIGCNGFYCFAFRQQPARHLITGRMFAPAIGIEEDPVTGNANGPLGAYLVHHGFSEIENGTFRFYAQQGVAIGRPGEMVVSVEVKTGKPEEVSITGAAICSLKGELL